MFQRYHPSDWNELNEYLLLETSATFKATKTTSLIIGTFFSVQNTIMQSLLQNVLETKIPLKVLLWNQTCPVINCIAHEDKISNGWPHPHTLGKETQEPSQYMNKHKILAMIFDDITSWRGNCKNTVLWGWGRNLITPACLAFARAFDPKHHFLKGSFLPMVNLTVQ